MKNAFIAGAAALGALASVAAQAAPTRDPSGVWLTEDGRARALVEKCGPVRDHLCGYIVWLKEPVIDGKTAADINNPDPKRRSRPIMGHQFILGLKLDPEGRYTGQIYNSEDGKKYDVEVWSEKAGELKVKGCLVAFLCSTQSWTRKTDTAPGQMVAATGTPGGPRPDPEWVDKSAAAAGTGQPAEGAASTARRETKPRS